MPNPGSARTAEDYVLLLRQARALSELTYWELEERANAGGYELPPAVLVEALGQAALPGEDLIVALLHACGHTDAEIGQWLQVRDRLAAAAAFDAAADAAPSARTDDPAGAPPRDADPTSTPAGTPGPGTAAAGTVDPAGVLDERTVVTASLAPSHAPSHAPSPAASTASTAPAAAAVHAGPRARHTLRVPGRGSRRAPGSPLRPLAMALGAAVVGIGSVVVIVSAVRDGDAAGPPVYTTGAPPRTAQAQPPGTVPGGPAATPSPTASPSQTTPPTTPPAQTGVLRSGTATLQNGQGIDFDGGGGEPDLVAYGAGDSIRADPSSRHFAPGPTATKQACAAVTSYQKSVQDLTAGQGICVRTDRDRYAHITVTGTAPLAFSYVVWS